ncbi:centrosomal protein of 44 kDa isoform X2 [Bos indicus x Bos taurus]|uniref:Centrosomal protein of 44 kDa n=1 Tax=Bos indicus x Bos taurus TaxID=30522 RepID=A0A4W2IPF1_BOBOX|nr:centrosomal protein of 44 kDa isoform X2 [Bos indicus x Bos taurus]
MATGDLKRSLRNLEQVLRSLNYPREVDCVGLVKGDTAASLPIISYSLTSYSPYVAELLVDSNIELLAKNDLRFIDTVYKLLRDQFNYKPILTKKQFIQCGFAEWKIQIICDILNCVMKKHKELSSLEKTPSQQRKKTSSAKSEPCSSTEKTSTEPVGIDVTGRFVTSGKKKAVVIRHLYNEDGANIPEDTVTDVNEAFDVCDIKAAEITIPELQVPDINCEQEDITVNPEVTALQSMLAECQEKLKKLTCIESRLESLEEKMKGKVLVNEKTWANLLSRVTLLETEMLLSKKNDEYIQFNEMSEDYSSSSDMDSLNPDRKSKEERHANIPLSSGYSTVSSDSTPRTSTVNYCGLKEISENLPTWSVPSSCSHPSRLRSRPPPASSSWTLPGPSPRLPLHFWDPMSPFPCCTWMF